MKSMWTEIRNIINQHQDNGGLLLSVIDKSGNLYYVNPEMRKVLESPDRKSKAINLFDHISPDRKDDFKISIMESEITGNHHIADLTVKNGHDHLLNLEIHPMEDETLQKKLFFCIGKEIKTITRKQSTPDPIHLPSVVYKSLLRNMPGMIWSIDEQENLVFANDAFLEYFRLTEKDLHKNIAKLLPEKVIDALYKKHVSVLKTGIENYTKQKVELANGTDVTFAVSIFLMDTASDKKIIGGHATVSDDYNLEKQLKEANDHILLLSRATTDAIWEWDMKTGHIFRNDMLRNMIGYSINESKGLAWWLRLIHPEDRNRVGDKIKNVTDQGLQSWEDEYRIKCADGEYKHIHDHGYVVYENGLAIKMIGSLHDISELKSLRSELHTEKLKRQQELSETVIHVQEMERTRIGFELHDNINQVISTAKLFVDMLIPSDKNQEKLKEKSVEYIVLAIDEIRKLSKDLVAPQLQERGLAESIRLLIDDINLSGKINIKFTHDYDTEMLSPSKKVTLFRIVQEQLKNIIKYSGAKNASIYLHSKDNTLKLLIEDNGIGFDSNHTRRGIGLSNIYERTRFYNGTVKIETAPGKGCSMIIQIPFE